MSVTSVAPIAGVATIAAPRAKASAAPRPRVVNMFILEALSDAERGVRAHIALREIEAKRVQAELRNVESETDADVTAEVVVVEVHERAAVVRRAAANSGRARFGEHDDRELAVGRQRDPQLSLTEQDVGPVRGVGVPAQILIGEDEQLVRRDRAGGRADPAVETERHVLGDREELRSVERDDLVGEGRAE